jgi:hypothetical protein
VTSDDADDPDAATSVIFSLSIHSEHPIAAFAGVPGRRRSPRPDDDFFYNFGTVTFSERDSATRADRLEAEVHAALDRVYATGIDLDELALDAVFVKAFFTFGPGAETISAELVQRLSRVHATIWIDAVES